MDGRMDDRHRSKQTDHVAAGWSDDRLRWIEAGRIRLDEEDKDGAVLVIKGHVGAAGAWLSSTELAGLARELAGWFADDPTETIVEIEAAAKRVLAELEAWNDRARSDEEHPPYEDLAKVLHGLVGRCESLRGDVGKFIGKRAD